MPLQDPSGHCQPVPGTWLPQLQSSHYGLWRPRKEKRVRGLGRGGGDNVGGNTEDNARTALRNGTCILTEWLREPGSLCLLSTVGEGLEGAGYCWCPTFCCSSASRFCCTMMTRYSSHCFWNSATFFLASSSSTDIISTFSLVSSILNNPVRSLLAWSSSSCRFSASSLGVGVGGGATKATKVRGEAGLPEGGFPR